jgi:hypothetical protein
MSKFFKLQTRRLIKKDVRLISQREKRREGGRGGLGGAKRGAGEKQVVTAGAVLCMFVPFLSCIILSYPLI